MLEKNKPEKSYIKSLDGLRGFAVLLVLLAHTNNVDVGFYINENFLFGGAGFYGVYLFFCLSAFLLTKQFLDKDLTKHNYKKFLSHYIYRRIVRIYPLFVLSVLTYYAVNLYLKTPYLVITDLRVVIETITLTDANGFYWTIPPEFKYYFVLPFAALFIIFFRKNVFVITSSLILVIIAVKLLSTDPTSKDLYNIVYIFLMGSYCAYINSLIEKKVKISNKYRIGFDLVSAVMLSLFIILIPHFFNSIFDTNHHRKYFAHDFLLFAIMSNLLILGTINGYGYLRSVFENRFLCFMGKISYSAYLWHILILIILYKIIHNYQPWVKFSIFITLTICAAYLSYRLIERPILKSRFLESKWANLLSRWE